MSCGVVCRHSLDPTLLWLWCRPAATAHIQPLAWEPSYAMGVALKRQKDQKKKAKIIQPVQINKQITITNPKEGDKYLYYIIPLPGHDD